MWKDIVEPDRPQMITLHAEYERLKYTITICITYCFSAAKTVELTRLDVTLYVLCLSCWRTYIVLVMQFSPARWWRDTNVNVALPVFISSPTFLLAPNVATVFLYCYINMCHSTSKYSWNRFKCEGWNFNFGCNFWYSTPIEFIFSQTLDVLPKVM